MIDNNVNWCVDCQAYAHVSQFDQSELKKRSRKHRRCKAHAALHAEWKREQKRLMQEARRRLRKYAHSPTKMRKWTLRLELARHSQSLSEFNQVNALIARARGAKGLAYVEGMAERPGGEAYREELPRLKKLLTDHALTKRLREGPDHMQVQSLVEFFAWNGPWWPLEALGSQQHNASVVPSSVVAGEAKAAADQKARMDAYHEARKYADLASDYARKIEMAAWTACAGRLEVERKARAKFMAKPPLKAGQK